MCWNLVARSLWKKGNLWYSMCQDKKDLVKKEEEGKVWITKQDVQRGKEFDIEDKRECLFSNQIPWLTSLPSHFLSIFKSVFIMSLWLHINLSCCLGFMCGLNLTIQIYEWLIYLAHQFYPKVILCLFYDIKRGKLLWT